MKSTAIKTILILIFSVCLFDAVQAEETFSAQTAPLAITAASVVPGVTGDHHRRRRRRVRRRIIWHRHHRRWH